jgi:hypothetical protein
MITNKELNEVTLSPTKKDYYQLWNELIELADKISERWSPASTNESDPGIVLLKVLTAVADKLNYNIDKNTLEAFMPSATQEDSMRKLTEMMGYDMQHYRSATGKATITYKSSNETPLKDFGEGIYFPKFINLKNEDEDINYVTLEEFTLQPNQDSREIAIIEGEVIECETNNDNIITALHLDDLNRYILPEYAIAENGIFVTNIKDSKESAPWRKEHNLNVQQPGTKVYKVGFDSAQQLPYVQFPEDIKTLIEDGLRIKYIRTNGLNGNIAAKVLSKLEKPALWSTADIDQIKNLGADSFTVTNGGACSNGADPESLDAAYNNYKKTIGTFDTLVTCRDYMNKIYQMTESDIDTTPLVSNIIVSDIRDDINRATPVCTFNEYGICYKDASLKESIILENVKVKDASDPNVTYTGTLETTQDRIEHFDLVFYPFKTVYGLNNKTEYKNSFKYNTENLEKIRADLALNKTIAHNIVQPVVGKDDKDIACIKNYLKLKARVTTTKKVTLIEEAEILNNIYKAIYTNFNARQIDFGEEIPYETLLSVLKNADYRIKEVNLDEPMLSTKFSLLDGSEEALSDAANTEELGNTLYNKLVRRNVLAGKISAFKYDNDFVSEYDKTSYPDSDYASVYPGTDEKIIKLESQFDVGTAFAATKEAEGSNFKGYVLKENEVIQFRVPNFKTTKTYPAYVNYFIKLNSDGGSKNAIPATFMSLDVYMASKPDLEQPVRWETFVNQLDSTKLEEVIITSTKEDPTEAEAEKAANFKTAQKTNVVLFSYDSINLKYAVADTYTTGTTYYYLPVDDDIFATFNSWIKSQPSKQPGETLEGIYRTVGVQEKPFGRLIDTDLKKYLPAYKFGAVSSNKEVLENFYVQDTRATDDPAIGTADGLGQDADYSGVPKDGEYKLKTGEYLLINYTDSKTDESGVERKTVVNKVYSEGDIIRANFELIDSALYNSNHSYSKRDGFSFAGRQPGGMFTLGTNEQIEIRDIVQVDLDEDGTYLYWTLNSDDPNALSNSFTFDENYGTGTSNAYTLKEGEHLYYTNSKKQDLVYYGAGTLIVKSIPSLELRKYTGNGEVSEEDIMTYGLAANIPWQPFSFNKTNKLTIIENQYISLTEGDVIIKIDGSDPTTAATMPAGNWNNWAQVGKVSSTSETKYRLAEDEVDSHLPPIVIDNVYWNVRSRLDFNMSKTTAQPLHQGDKLTITFKNSSNAVSTETLKPTAAAEYAPVYVNSNYTCQAAVDTLDFTSLLEEDFALKLKVSSQSTPTISDHEDLRLNNYINGEAKYTKFDFENLPANHESEPAFNLNISLPESSLFGLIMIYYIEDPEEVNKENYESAKITADIAGIELFNKAAADTYIESITLSPGMNIIKLKSPKKIEGDQSEPGVTSLSFTPDTSKKSTVVFGSLDIVSGINPKLDYRLTDKTDKLQQLLADIQKDGIATDFYYNVPIQRSNEIDLNAAVADDLLSSPLSWYDPNNVNRKFVISEIDADYLSTGITLTKASRA